MSLWMWSMCWASVDNLQKNCSSCHFVQPKHKTVIQFLAGSLVCSLFCLWRGIGVHVSANHCSGHRPSSLAMTPWVWWILSVPSRSCGLLFSKQPSWIVGLSSVRSTKLCRVGNSFIANLYSTGKNEGLRCPFVGSGNVFNSPWSNMYICFGIWKQRELWNCKLLLITVNCKTISFAKIVL